LAPAHAGITHELLSAAAADDGVLVPLRPEVARAAEGRPVRITGLEGSTPDARALAAAADADDGATETPPPDEAVDAVARAEEESRARPDTARFSREVPYESPAVDAYSLRLVAPRRLYDLGTLVQHAPSLKGLTPGSTLLVHPTDLARLGVADGGQVKVTSPRTSATLDAHASNGVPRGAAVLTVNQPGPDPADLIDASQPVTDIRIENP
jgi:anaerobic selenocysteine-containing dehydrogenase